YKDIFHKPVKSENKHYLLRNSFTLQRSCIVEFYFTIHSEILAVVTKDSFNKSSKLDHTVNKRTKIFRYPRHFGVSSVNNKTLSPSKKVTISITFKPKFDLTRKSNRHCRQQNAHLRVLHPKTFYHTQKSVHATIIVEIPKLPGEEPMYFETLLLYPRCRSLKTSIFGIRGEEEFDSLPTNSARRTGESDTNNSGQRHANSNFARLDPKTSNFMYCCSTTDIFRQLVICNTSKIHSIHTFFS
ncbi:hypothetical protein L9F63_004894, partial [Diploptera punctata]